MRFNLSAGNRSAWMAGLAVLGLMVWTGCRTTPVTPSKSGFLTTYNNLQQEDATTWRYVEPNHRLAKYTKFMVPPVKVLVYEYEGKSLTDAERQKASEGIRQILVNALGDKYPVVNEPGIETAEIRIALTDAFKQGAQVGLTLEGEVLDSYSGVQVAALMQTKQGEPYLASWWDKPAAKQMIEEWAQRFRRYLDSLYRP